MRRDEGTRRHEEIRLLMERTSDDLEQAAAAMSEIGHAEDSVHRQSVEDAALDALRAMREGQDALYRGAQTLALALNDRGTPIAHVARALGVSRGTILNWRAQEKQR